jgi:hypothetical protein
MGPRRRTHPRKRTVSLLYFPAPGNNFSLLNLPGPPAAFSDDAPPVAFLPGWKPTVSKLDRREIYDILLLGTGILIFMKRFGKIDRDAACRIAAELWLKDWPSVTE